MSETIHDGATVACSGTAEGAVVLMPSAFGVAPDLRAQMDELSRDAGTVVALNPFFRDDGGVIPYDDLARVMARLRALDTERAYSDLCRVIESLRRNHAQIVLVGICFGGPYALRAAADGLVDAVVTWHGTRMEEHLHRASEMRCPMRLHFGALDPLVPPRAVEAVRAAFAGRNDVHVIVHDGATHGFTHRDAVAYDERAERAALASVREVMRPGGGDATPARAGA